MITGKEQPDSAATVEDRPDRQDRLRRSGARLRSTARQDRVRRNLRRQRHPAPSANTKPRRAPTSAASTSRAAIRASWSANLSGGERGRLHLAKTLISGGNVLLLDEPSNDLDVETLRALEDALLEFAGCVLVISHDRWFLDRIATHILAAEGDSQVELLRRQLSGIRGGQDEASGRRRRQAEADSLQADHPLNNPAPQGYFLRREASPLAGRVRQRRRRMQNGHRMAPVLFLPPASARG